MSHPRIPGPALIPQPHFISMRRGRFHRPARGIIALDDARLAQPARHLQALLPRHDVAGLVAGESATATLRLAADLEPEAYRLDIDRAGIEIEAASAAGAMHAVRTLAQIAQQQPPGCWPNLSIADWPDFPERGVYYDVSRGRVPTVASLKRQVEQLAAVKVNHFQLYIEHTFAFRKHPAIGRGASPLTAADILELDEFCAERGIELVPSLASFGHLSTVLCHPRYHHLAEDWGVGRYISPEAATRKLRIRRGWSLAPANPAVYEFLDDLFAEFLPLFRSRRFNVCCDETYDLGLGQSYPLCKRIGKGPLYLRHLVRLNRLCRRHGKQMLFWGDIIRHYPGLIARLPPDVVVLDWGYAARHPFDRVADFKRAGVPFFVCPGTSSWVSLFPRLPEAQDNIAGFAAAGRRHGALGMLTTDWGDGGHYNFMEFSWNGYLYGAEQAWNTGADRASFTRRFATLFLRDGSATLSRAIQELGDISQVEAAGYYQGVWQHVFFAGPDSPLFGRDVKLVSGSVRGRIAAPPVIRWNAAYGRTVERRLRAVRGRLAACARKSGTDPHGVLPYWIYAVDTLMHAARKLAAFGQGGTVSPARVRILARESARLERRFQSLWMARNRRSEIRITLKRFRTARRALATRSA